MIVSFRKNFSVNNIVTVLKLGCLCYDCIRRYTSCMRDIKSIKIEIFYISNSTI